MQSYMEINYLKKSIDVIIPSYRLNIDFLVPILSLKKPTDWEVNHIIIADNPNLNIPNELDAFIERGVLTIIENEINLGAPESRNKGIQKAKSEWILFLDDDVIPNDDLIFQYTKAAKKYSNPYQGFIGVTRFPKPINSFTKGVISSDILTFFSLAEFYEEMAWGVTANLMVRRNAIGSHRFLTIFPKFGGGEDIDICLNVMLQFIHKFRTISKATVNHPWWSDRFVAYKRFFRWAYGDSQLPKLHPEFKYSNFPNIIETIFLGMIIAAVFFFFTKSTIFIPLLIGIIFGEIMGEWIKLFSTKKEISVLNAIESTMIRAFNDFGRLAGNLSRKHVSGFFERFDYFCNGKHIHSERKWALIKFNFYIIFTIIFYILIILK